MSYSFKFKVIGILFVVAGLVLFSSIFGSLKDTIETFKSNKYASAEVVEIELNNFSSPPDQTLVLKYKIDNKEYINPYEKHTTNWARFKKGEKVEIIYNINNPSVFWIGNDINYYLFKIVFIEIFLLLSGILIYLFSNKIEKAINLGIIQIGD